MTVVDFRKYCQEDLHSCIFKKKVEVISFLVFRRKELQCAKRMRELQKSECNDWKGRKFRKKEWEREREKCTWRERERERMRDEIIRMYLQDCYGESAFCVRVFFLVCFWMCFENEKNSSTRYFLIQSSPSPLFLFFCCFFLM